MAIRDAFLGEFDHEMANARKTLERVPDAEWDWRPDPKSFSMGSLATHIATIPMWGSLTLTTTQLDLKPEDRPPVPTNRKELLAQFDKHVAEAKAAIQAASDDALSEPWTLSVGGKPVFTLPRRAVLRSMVFNHLYHHRGQLTVYFRLKGIPVPALYGPSADEQ